MKNKKADTGTIIVMIIISLLFISFVSIMIIISHENNEKDKACKNIGYEKRSNINSIPACEDEEGNLHYAKFECKPRYWAKCKANLITIGNKK